MAAGPNGIIMIIFLNAVNKTFRALEYVLVDTISAVSPWLAPILPAYIAGMHMHNVLLLPAWISYVGAGVVELLGLSAVTTAVQFWDYNDIRRKTDQRAPFWVAVVCAVFYMSVVLTVNVVLDGGPGVHKIAKALLSSLSIVAAIILASRGQHTRRMQSIQEEKEDRRKMRSNGHRPERNLHETYTQDAQIAQDWRTLPDEDKILVQDMSVNDIMRTYGTKLRTAQNWKARSNNGNN
jgi:hypothetical protein